MEATNRFHHSLLCRRQYKQQFLPAFHKRIGYPADRKHHRLCHLCICIYCLRRLHAYQGMLAMFRLACKKSSLRNYNLLNHLARIRTPHLFRKYLPF
jgi:hypothetical protein